MYNVSDSYLSRINEPVQRFKLNGKINDVEFDENNILASSFSITKQCSDNSKVTIGSAFVAELKATFLIEGIEWKDAVIEISEGLRLDDKSYEYVPLGVFNVSKAMETEKGIDITAYDNMSKFDRPFDFSMTTGDLYTLVFLAADKCNVAIGMSREEFSKLPNAETTFVMYASNDIKTYRDFVYWIAQTCCSIATMDRQGRLIFLPYTQTITDTIDKDRRFSGVKISLFETRYSGMSIVNMEDKSTQYFASEFDEFLTYELGNNPFLQYGDEEGRYNARNNVFNGLLNIKYAPFTAQVLVGAHYDLTDVLKFTGGIADEKKLSCINKITYTFGRGVTLEGFGQDPALASAKSKEEKEISNVSEDDTKDLIFYVYENAKEIDISDGATRNVVEMKFTSINGNKVIFNANILLHCETDDMDDDYHDLTATVTYLINNEVLEEYIPVETYVDGRHILSLFYIFAVAGGTLNEFVVKLNASGGSIHIDPYGSRATIYGQGLVATDDFSGFISLEENFADITSNQTMILDSLEITYEKVINDIFDYSFEESYGDITIEQSQLLPINGHMKLTRIYDIVMNHESLEFNPDDVFIDDNNVIKIFGYAPQEVIGCVFSWINLEEISEITMDVKNCEFMFSNDKQSWKGYKNGSWNLSQHMLANDVLALNTGIWQQLIEETDALYIDIIMTDDNSEINHVTFGIEEVMI